MVRIKTLESNEFRQKNVKKKQPKDFRHENLCEWNLIPLKRIYKCWFTQI